MEFSTRMQRGYMVSFSGDSPPVKVRMRAVSCISRLSSLSLSFPLNDSMYSFSQGLPGSMKHETIGMLVTSKGSHGMSSWID